ncbi:PD-(D/E)XK nuclease family protein [Bacillus subtilis]|uniref:PD-(D/E)XK nuclease family protein n=1 Tax=Bacillus subtilis TaxID=1423 RepID=UPI002DC02EC2|nr:PD-(D/E)XK nuclease family protein [Bacillus subtilis]MEC2137406.1 PD-(D/E)XK nuclease family protein [Bacillus subtilis]
MKDKLNELREQGKNIYSFSKLGTFNNCEYEYYNTYVLKKKGIDNIYTLMGSELHNGIEKIYKNELDIKKFKKDFENRLIELEMNGVSFPSESIGDSWKADVGHFMNNFNKIDSKMILEKLMVFEIAEGIYLQGYVDAILPSEKGKPYVSIYDWKTSSKFTGKKLNEAGRQLLMYKLALEQTTNLKVDKILWFMVKYVYVCTHGKTKVIKKMCNRGKWVKEMRKQLEKQMKNLRYDDFEIEVMLDNVVKENNLNSLPEEVKNKFWLEDCTVEYEVTDEKVNELKNYIADTVERIENKDREDEKQWQPVKINKFNSFYCSVLCGHRKTCKFYKEFLESNKFKKKNNTDMFDNLFS